MYNNVRIARQLVRIAKSLVAYQHSFPSMDFIEKIVTGVLRQDRIPNNVFAYGNRICGLINIGDFIAKPEDVPEEIVESIKQQEFNKAFFYGIDPGDGDDPDSLDVAGGIDNNALDKATLRRIQECSCNYLDIHVEPERIRLHLCRRYLDGKGKSVDTNEYDSEYTLAQFGDDSLAKDQLVFDENDDREWFEEDFTYWFMCELRKSNLGI